MSLSNSTMSAQIIELIGQVGTLEESVRQLWDTISGEKPTLYIGFRVSRRERALLNMLMRATGPCSVEQLLRGQDGDERAIRVVVHRLRKKLGGLNPPIHVGGEYGAGYYISAENKVLILAHVAPA